MNIFGRILIILTVFAIVMGVAYLAVNTLGASSPTTAPAFASASKSFPDVQSSDFRGGDSTSGLIFGLLKNTGIVAVIVALNALPKSLAQKGRQPVRVRIIK